jgi:hypothetical protein
MEIELIAFDSMGVRSMCTRIKTAEVDLVIDPSAMVAPQRYGLPPHRLERERLAELLKTIAERAMKANLLAVTHYHQDHFDTGELMPLEIYSGKRVLMKDPKGGVNSDQGDFHAPLLMGMVREWAEKVEVADGTRFYFGGTSVEFSKAVPHGSGSSMGFVTEVMVEEGGDRVIHSSDVQGFVKDEQAEFVTRNRPRIVIADGPATYMLGRGFKQEDLDSSIGNIKRILGCGVKELILDHHLLRGMDYGSFFGSILKEFPNSRVMTAAEFMGKENCLLEASRKDLYNLGQ